MKSRIEISKTVIRKAQKFIKASLLPADDYSSIREVKFAINELLAAIKAFDNEYVMLDYYVLNNYSFETLEQCKSDLIKANTNLESKRILHITQIA